MALNLISFPFRLDKTGGVAVVAEDSDEHYMEELAMLILTQVGERTLVPDYGVSDPTFEEVDLVDLTLANQLFGPPIVVTEVRTYWVDATTQDVIVTFDRDIGEASDDEGP